MRSVRTGLVLLIGVLCLQLVVALALVPLLPWLVVGLVLVSIFGVIVR